MLGPQRERLFSNNNTSQDDRASKLKARNEKARRDYFSNDPNVDNLSDRFSRLNEYPGQRQIDYRGPLLQQFNSGDLRSSDFDSGPTLYNSGLARPDTRDFDQVSYWNVLQNILFSPNVHCLCANHRNPCFEIHFALLNPR